MANAECRRIYEHDNPSELGVHGRSVHRSERITCLRLQFPSDVFGQSALRSRAPVAAERNARRAILPTKTCGDSLHNATPEIMHAESCWNGRSGGLYGGQDTSQSALPTIFSVRKPHRTTAPIASGSRRSFNADSASGGSRYWRQHTWVCHDATHAIRRRAAALIIRRR